MSAFSRREQRFPPSRSRRPAWICRRPGRISVRRVRVPQRAHHGPYQRPFHPWRREDALGAVMQPQLGHRRAGADGPLRCVCVPRCLVQQRGCCARLDAGGDQSSSGWACRPTTSSLATPKPVSFVLSTLLNRSRLPCSSITERLDHSAGAQQQQRARKNGWLSAAARQCVSLHTQFDR